MLYDKLIHMHYDVIVGISKLKGTFNTNFKFARNIKYYMPVVS